MSALLKFNRVHAQMPKALVSGCHRAVAALNSCCSHSRFSAAVVIAMGILSSLMITFPLFLNLSRP